MASIQGLAPYLRNMDTLHDFTYPCPTCVGHRHSQTLFRRSQTQAKHIGRMRKLGYVIDSCSMHMLWTICYCSHPNM